MHHITEEIPFVRFTNFFRLKLSDYICINVRASTGFSSVFTLIYAHRLASRATKKLSSYTRIYA